MDRKLLAIFATLAFALVVALGPTTAMPVPSKYILPTAPRMTVEWTWNVSKYAWGIQKNLYGVTLGAVVADDIDKDGSIEILFAFRKAERRVICLSSKTKDFKWVYPPIDQDPFNAGDPWGIASIEDIDGDKVKEILIIARDKNLHCITPTGQKKWMYECGGSECAPALYDVNKDGKLEIIIGPLKTSMVTMLDNTGKKIWDFPVNSYRNCGSTAFDVDRDNQVEVLTVDGAGNLYCLSSGGTEKWRFEMGGVPHQEKPVVADVDNDGEYEILVYAHSRMVYCLSFFGVEKWRFEIGKVRVNATTTYWDLVEKAGKCEGGFAVADVDADGSLEVLVGDWIGNHYCINGATGTQKWYTHYPSEMWTGITVGDVNGDGKVDVVSGSDGDSDAEVYEFFGLKASTYPMGVLAAVDGKTGDTVGTYPAAVASCQCMGDWDGDGKLEIAVYMEEAAGLFYMLTMDGKYDAKLVPWPFRFKNLYNNPVVEIPEPALFATVILAFALAQGVKRRGR